MKIISDYHCPKCEKVVERYWDRDIECPCAECGEIMTKRISAAMTNGNSAHGMLQRKKF